MLRFILAFSILTSISAYAGGEHAPGGGAIVNEDGTLRLIELPKLEKLDSEKLQKAAEEIQRDISDSESAHILFDRTKWDIMMNCLSPLQEKQLIVMHLLHGESSENISKGFAVARQKCEAARAEEARKVPHVDRSEVP